MISLKGQFLVAMPSMVDEQFRESVIYLVGHGEEEGAMGLMVNRTLPDLRFADILDELGLGDEDESIRIPDPVKDRSVLQGGPVDTGRGFVLHSTDYFRDGNSYLVSDEVGLTATVDVLKAVAFGDAPAKSLLALGYCGWSPGQLEDEIQENGWLTVPFSRELIFETPVEKRYDVALQQLGITRATLSGAAGHA